VDAPYGVAMKTAFAAAISELDAQARVVRAQSYPSGTTTFGPTLAPLVGAAGGADLDALLVVDAGGPVGLVAPALALAGLWSAPAGAGLPEGARGGRPVQLLLPSAAFDPALPRQAARYLEGAVVATGFFPESPSVATATFVARYRERFAAEPNYVAAFAHDAFLRVRDAGAKSRAGLRDALLRGRAASGASALGVFGSAREPTEAVQLVRVAAGAFAPL
jgi:ABC-type branched-subunit amino acid transport system substrate-binding protein